MAWADVQPVVDLSVRELCQRPYLDHPKGCPNYGKKGGCPPTAPTIDAMIDLSGPVYVIWNKFGFASHVERMRAKHPTWSKRQVECCLYWQPRARKQLREIVDGFLVAGGPDWRVVWTPEAAGVNVTATMANVGMFLEWPPVTTTYQVVLAGHRLAGAKDNERRTNDD